MICAVPPAIGVAALVSHVSTAAAAAPTLPAAESVVEFSDRPHATSATLIASATADRRAVTTFTSRMLSPMMRSGFPGRTRRTRRGELRAVCRATSPAAPAAAHAGRR